MTARRLQSVPDPCDLPEYPPELFQPDLTRGYFMMMWHHRWLSSRLCLTGSLAVQGAALNLYMHAQTQLPVGSLPADHAIIARLLRVTDEAWHGLMQEHITPLHGWTHYAAGAEVVLGHPVVIEVAMAALERHEARRLSREDQAVRARRLRLVDLLREIGCSDALCGDARAVAWIDDWLVRHHPGQRRRPQVEASISRALKAASAEGILNRH
jgi:hypothetical protein